MNDNNRNFIRIFWSYTMVIILPVFILGFVTVGILFGNLADDTEKLNMSIIQQSADVMDGEISKTFASFYQMEEDEVVKESVRALMSGHSVGKYDLYDLSTKIALFRSDSSITKRIGYYVGDSDIVVSNVSIDKLRDFYDMSCVSCEYTFEEFKEKFDNGGIKSYFISGTDAEGNDVLIWYKGMNIGGNLTNATMFAVWGIDDIIAGMNINMNKDIELAIIDADDKLLACSEGFDVDYKDRDSINGKDVIEVKSKVLDCRYIYKFADGGLAGNVKYIMFIFLLLTFVTMLICVALAFLHMKRMQKMMLGIFNESKGLEDSLTEQLENAKERILGNLLHNIKTDTMDASDIATKYGINFQEKYFAVMSVSNGQTDNNDIYTHTEEAAWIELNRIIKDRLSDIHINCEVVRTASNVFSYILNYDQKGASAMLRVLPGEINKTYGISISFGVGNEVESVEELDSSYEASVSALRFGISERPGEAVYYEEIQNQENAKIYYTGEKEKQLIRGIKTGSENTVSEILDEIFEVNFRERHISHSNLKRLIFNMSLTVYKVLDEAYDSDDAKHENYGRVCQNLYRNDNVEECFDILREICLSLCDGIVKKTGEDAIKTQIVEYIGANYSDDSLSLESLAEHLEISYHYLSRLFKEYLGTNFVSYLTLIRLEKAKDLLKTTNNTIEHIAEQTGFVSSNSLIRAFKKYYDVTPGKFRKG